MTGKEALPWRGNEFSNTPKQALMWAQLTLYERTAVMQYILTFLEGVITFISPCLLPMLPIYVSYFAGGGSTDNATDSGRAGVEGSPHGNINKVRALKNALGFVLGFTLIFVSLGIFAGNIGRVLRTHSTALNAVTGLIVIILGLNYLSVLRIPFLNGSSGFKRDVRNLGFFSSLLFGIVFSIGWTPCVGAFLGSALMMASRQGYALEGGLMLLTFSLGLGLPFVVSALLIEQLKGAISFIKTHYRAVNIFSGSLLVLVGILMMTGFMGYFLSLLTFV